MWDYLTALASAFVRPSMVFLVVFGLTLMGLFALLFYWVEGGGENPTVTSLFDAVYFSVTAMTTVGLGDVHPVSNLGRALAMLMMILGSGLFVSFTAVIAAIVMEIEEDRRQAGRDQESSELR